MKRKRSNKVAVNVSMCRELILRSGYIESFDSCKCVSKGFVSDSFVRRIRITNGKLKSSEITNLLLKKCKHVIELNLSHCELLNSRHLNRIVSHFVDLKTLVLSGCHSLVCLPDITRSVRTVTNDLWRIYKPDPCLSSTDVVRAIINAYQYIKIHCWCDHSGVNACVRTIKKLCTTNSQPMSLYIIDIFLDHMIPFFRYRIDKIEITDTDTEKINIAFSNFQSEEFFMCWEMKKVQGCWYLNDPW